MLRTERRWKMKIEDIMKHTIREDVFSDPDSTFPTIGCFLVWRETTPEEQDDLVADHPFVNEVYGCKGGEEYRDINSWNAALETNDKRLFMQLKPGQRFMTLGISTNDDSGLLRYRFGVEITPELLKEMVNMARDAGWYNKPHTTDAERQQAMAAHSTFNPVKPD